MSPADERAAARYWGQDLVLAAVLEAQPGSPLFNEAVDVLSRLRVPALNQYLRAADLRDILREMDIPYQTLASRLEIPPAHAYAIGTGWSRPIAYQLFLIAQELGVPVGMFFHDSEFETRPRVRLYREWMDLDEMP